MENLMLLAVLPGLYFVFKVYKLDKIEKEPVKLLVKLLIFGGIAIIPAVLVEIGFEAILTSLYDEADIMYVLIENFLGVALVEEFFKRFFLKKLTWKNDEFNYVFDGIVYSVTVSMGFAIFENVLYVAENGLVVALLRMVTAIPAHAIFAIFMGHHYGMAKAYALAGEKHKSNSSLKKALIVPTLIHGLYDFTASIENELMIIVFIIIVIIMNIIGWKRLKTYSKLDVKL